MVRQLWKTVNPNIKDAKRAGIKAKVLTNTYPLQGDKPRQKMGEDPKCQLCGDPVEDTTHFILKCSALDQARQPLLQQIIEATECHSITDESLMQVIMDCTKSPLAPPYQVN